jgi:hypothetical protein
VDIGVGGYKKNKFTPTQQKMIRVVRGIPKTQTSPRRFNYDF